jgi:hypothetical protein
MNSSSELDETRAGDWEWDRRKYEVIQGAMRLLKAKLDVWNKTALSHGAIAAPYSDEVGDLGRMIEWADERLKNPELHEIEVRGVTVGSLRYIKAALLHAAWHFDTEAMEQAKEGWPPRVLEAVRGRARRAHEIAAEIKYQPAGVLEDLRTDFSMDKTSSSTAEWDIFISHASEDKGSFVNALAASLKAAGLSIWYDDFTLSIGDSLRRSIDKGLARSKFGVVVLSHAFFEKEWPQRELDGLVSRESSGQKVVLPVWHGVELEYVRRFSPMLADRLGISSGRGLDAVARAILQAVRE